MSIHKTINIGIIGATGYAGGELVRLLLGHPNANIKWLGSHSYIDKPYHELYPNTRGFTDRICIDDDVDVAQLGKDVDLIFTATPHGLCAKLVAQGLLEYAKVIDLGADFRIQNADAFERWYGMKHPAPAFLAEAVYGLCERYREELQGARLIANPGCYPTCTFLSVYPLLKEGLIDAKTLIIDAKSGTSGAGRGAKLDFLYCEVNENIKAYGVGTHRHIPEIEQELSIAHGSCVTVSFTPHLVPMNRGILITAYASLTQSVNQSEMDDIYDKYYKDEYFVRPLGGQNVPQTRHVSDSNFTDVCAKLDPRTNRAVMMGAMDNLVKGAAGQAVQNMNLMFGLEEGTGIAGVPMFL